MVCKESCIWHKVFWMQVKKDGDKGHIRIVEKVQETSSGTGMHNRAITVLHKQ